MPAAGITYGQLTSTSPASQESSQQRLPVAGGAWLRFTLDVLPNHALDLFKLIPGDVTVMNTWDQSQPLLSRFSPADMMRANSLVAGGMFCLAVAVGSPIDGRSQQARHGTIDGALPVCWCHLVCVWALPTRVPETTSTSDARCRVR